MKGESTNNNIDNMGTELSKIEEIGKNQEIASEDIKRATDLRSKLNKLGFDSDSQIEVDEIPVENNYSFFDNIPLQHDDVFEAPSESQPQSDDSLLTPEEIIGNNGLRIAQDTILPEDNNFDEMMELLGTITTPETPVNNVNSKPKTEGEIIAILRNDLNKYRSDYKYLISKIKNEGPTPQSIKEKENIYQQIQDIRDELADYGIYENEPLEDIIMKKTNFFDKIKHNFKKIKTSVTDKFYDLKEFTSDKYHNVKNFISNHKKGVRTTAIFAVIVLIGGIAACNVNKAIKNHNDDKDDIKGNGKKPTTSAADTLDETQNQDPTIMDNVEIDDSYANSNSNNGNNIPENNQPTNSNVQNNIYMTNPNYIPEYYNYYEEIRTIFNISADEAIDKTNRAIALYDAGYCKSPDGIMNIVPIVRLEILIENNEIIFAENVDDLAVIHNELLDFAKKVENGTFNEQDAAKLAKLPLFTKEGSDLRANLEQAVPLIIERFQNPSNTANNNALKNHFFIFIHALGGVIEDNSYLTNDTTFNNNAIIDAPFVYFTEYKAFFTPFRPGFTAKLDYENDYKEIKFWQDLNTIAENAYQNNVCKKR